MIDIILQDLYRCCGDRSYKSYIKQFLRNRTFRKLFYYRKYNAAQRAGKILCRIMYHFVSKNDSIDLPLNCSIGEGLLILHPYDIAINSGSRIGRNCTILKGVTIGNTKTGKIGAPKIGDNVYIGPNSTIVGNVKIGDNVLISGNTFINFDVPNDSIVIGSPGVIHRKEKASSPYIVNDIRKE